MAIRTRNFKSLVWTTSLEIVFFHVLIFVLIGYEFTQGSDHVLFTLFFWAGSLLLITFYHILKLLRKIDREIKMLTSEKLLEENQSQLFRIEEMLEVYSDLRSSHQENARLLEREQQHNQELILQLSATSHDLKTPLTVIKGNAELLELAQLGQPQADYAAEILQASHKMEEYCGSLIDYAKTFQIDSNQFSRLSLGSFLAYLQDDWALFSKQGSYRFSLQEDCDLSLNLLIHLDYLKRALLNILLNALEHADQDQKEVKLTVSVQQDQLVFSIWNNGPAFSEEMLLGAEQLFYQSDQSRNSANPHHGIGLAFSKQVALLHGGRLTLLNPDQGGACVELTVALKSK